MAVVIPRQVTFVFEWVERDLADALGSQQSPAWDDFSEQYALPILDALAHAHERQVSHRDIKPNILVTDEGIPKTQESLYATSGSLS
jgi:serine/threonine protein kinase